MEKIYNPQVFDKFTAELRRTLIKNPKQEIRDMVKLLFHGTFLNAAETVLNSEVGIDLRI